MTHIAVACMEDGRLSRHFGRSTHFQIFSVAEGGIRAITTARVEPILAGMGRGLAPGSQHGHGHHHGHDNLLGALEGCSVVLAGGMGEGVAGSLSRHGISPVVADGAYTPEEAVLAYLCGDLRTKSVHACCGHRHDPVEH